MKVETGYLYLRHLLSDISDEKIIVPSYQREYCWDNSKIELFIDSLLRDIPVGLFQFRKVKDKMEVIDGLHRIRTLYNILKGNGIYFNFEKNTFTTNPEDYDYSPYVFKNGELSVINILGGFENQQDFDLSKQFAPFYEKIYFTPLLKFIFDGTDEEVAESFARINDPGVQFTPAFVQVNNESILKL